MKSNLKSNNKVKLLDEIGWETKFQILQYDFLKGTSNLEGINNIRSLEASGRRLKQIRILLDNSSVKIQNDDFIIIKGNIEEHNELVNENSIKKAFFSNILKNTISIKPVYKGNGEIFLKSSYDDFIFIELVDEEIIINNDIFCACDEEINIKEDKNRNELILSGYGNVVLKLPIAEEEILRCRIFNERLIVNEDIHILRTEKVRILKENKRDINGEMLEETYNIFEGAGEVWLIPTKVIYDKYLNLNYDCINQQEEKE